MGSISQELHWQCPLQSDTKKGTFLNRVSLHLAQDMILHVQNMEAGHCVWLTLRQKDRGLEGDRCVTSVHGIKGVCNTISWSSCALGLTTMCAVFGPSGRWHNNGLQLHQPEFRLTCSLCLSPKRSYEAWASMQYTSCMPAAHRPGSRAQFVL